MKGKEIIAGLFWATFLLLVACGGRVSQQVDAGDVVMEFEPMSTAVGETMVMVTLKDGDGNSINDASLSVRGDMTHAGMTPVVEEIASGENGVYQVPFEWTMGGDWFVTIDATLADGTVVTRRFEDISIEGEGEMTMDDMEDMDGMEEMEMDHGAMVMAGDLSLSGVMGNLALPSDTGAVYVTIANNGTTDDALVGGTINGCENVELHDMMMEDDVMVMRPVEGGEIPIPAGETVKLQRGGLHVMCIGKSSFDIGGMAEVTLSFANAGDVSLMVPVVDPADIDAMGGMDMEGMHSEDMDMSDEEMDADG
ncbi:MAG: copper chaperone PCu(A)C [Ardenticatenaceae bacterium]|nr:copper chaperone PCu(A)C [Ardenticatenaceae bacterium]